VLLCVLSLLPRYLGASAIVRCPSALPPREVSQHSPLFPGQRVGKRLRLKVRELHLEEQGLNNKLDSFLLRLKCYTLGYLPITARLHLVIATRLHLDCSTSLATFTTPASPYFLSSITSIHITILRPDDIMAVLSDVPGLQVQILVQGKALNEYRDRDAKTSGRTVERYVEAQSGMQFEIRYIFEESFPVDRPLSMIVTIDGKAVDEPLIRPHEILDPNGHISYGSILKSDSGCEVRKYQFLSIDISKWPILFKDLRV
jgi:hypothetical protein